MSIKVRLTDKSTGKQIRDPKRAMDLFSLVQHKKNADQFEIQFGDNTDVEVIPEGLPSV